MTVERRLDRAVRTLDRPEGALDTAGGYRPLERRPERSARPGALGGRLGVGGKTVECEALRVREHHDPRHLFRPDGGPRVTCRRPARRGTTNAPARRTTPNASF